MNSKKTALLLLTTVGLITACSQKKEKITDKNVVRVEQLNGSQKVGSFMIATTEHATQEEFQNTSLSEVALEGVPLKNSKAAAPSDEQKQQSSNSLQIGYPFSYVGQEQVMGAIITKVSAKDNADLGRMKLTDLPPVHSTITVVDNGQDEPFLAIVGCPGDCAADSEAQILTPLPVAGIDQENELLYIDFAALGRELDLMAMLDPNGEALKLKSVSSRTTLVDLTDSTLIFDVETVMDPVPTNGTEEETSADDGEEKVELTRTTFTVRWYIKMESATNPNFVPRSPRQEIGFFTTERSRDTKITRFGTENKVKYFVKNVPEEHRAAFSAAFDSWNETFVKIIGKELLEYEYVEESDSRHELLVPGDVRYNILEWDLVNKAPYGGLGPSYANQTTGQIFSANTLVQGPTIVEMYSKWFSTIEEVKELRKSGQLILANQVLNQARKSLLTRVQEMNREVRLEMKLGNMKFRVHANSEALEDPMAAKLEFWDVPEGQTYETYMFGYFKEMVAHELGHNLGLRHNFRGNMGASEDGETVSRSIMEYLGRPFRHKAGISDYDHMAIAFGYNGDKPQQKDWFCTDEHVGSIELQNGSAECSKSDATVDPYSFFEMQLDRVIGFLIDKDSTETPAWNPKEMKRQIDSSLEGLLLYAAAKENAKAWTNFYGKEDRPSNPADVPAYVLARLEAQLCSSSIDDAIAKKTSEDAKNKATENIQALRSKATEMLGQIGKANKSLNCM